MLVLHIRSPEQMWYFSIFFQKKKKKSFLRCSDSKIEIFFKWQLYRSITQIHTKATMYIQIEWNMFLLSFLISDWILYNTHKVEWSEGVITLWFPQQWSRSGENRAIRPAASVFSSISVVGFGFLNRDGRFRMCTSFLNCCPKGF